MRRPSPRTCTMRGGTAGSESALTSAPSPTTSSTARAPDYGGATQVSLTLTLTLIRTLTLTLIPTLTLTLTLTLTPPRPPSSARGVRLWH